MTATKLVIGASGFLGSHVTRQLVASGDDVRVLIRPTSSTRGIDELPVDVRRGDIFDPDSVRSAMLGCDVVYDCVVDARPWLLDPASMWRTNVDGLKAVLDVATEADLHRFVFTCSFATIGRSSDGPADETTAHNWLDIGGVYVRSRVEAERMVLQYTAEKGLPAVAMCVSNTYGPGDWLPTPHGGLLSAAVRGKLLFYIDGFESETVGIEDAARALILAGRHGRIGERYIVSERWMSAREIFEAGCGAVGVAPPRRRVPIPMMAAASYPSSWIARARGRDTMLTLFNIRLMHIMTPMDHSKVVRELGGEPSPTPDAIAAAAHFFRASRRRESA